MSDDQVVKPVEPSEPVVTDPTPATPVADTTPATDPNEQFLVKTTVDGEEKVFDIRDASQKQELTELGQKGFHYTKNMQEVAKIRDNEQARDAMLQQIASDPVVWEMAMAKKMGFDPSLVTANLQKPDPSWEQINPVAYGQALANYDNQLRGQQAVKGALQQYINETSQANNAALFSRTKLTHNLNEQEFSSVVGFVSSRFKPNGLGMYNEADMEHAVNAVLGKDRIEKAKLSTANNIQTKIKNAISPPSAPKKPNPENARQSRDQAYKDFVKDFTSAR